MMRNMTRSRLIQAWLAAVALRVAAAVTLGVTVTVATLMTLLALSLVPVVIVLMLSPAAHARTASDVIHDRNRGA